MGLKTAQNIIDDAEEILQDKTNAIWLEANHLKALNDGQRMIVTLKPEANMLIGSFKCIEGTKQTLPSPGGNYLFDIIRNMGTGGSTPGTAPTLVDRKLMDAVLSTWHAATAAAVVVHWMYEPMVDPKVFWVYPPQPSSSQGYLQLQYSYLPVDIEMDDTITLDDAYADVLVSYILFRAWQAKKPELATGYWTLFLAQLGLQKQQEAQDNPAIKPVKGGMP